MTAVKLFAALPKPDAVPAQQFHDHWRHPHGTLAKRISLMRQYVQSHRIESPIAAVNDATFEGVTEVWYDSVADALGAGTEPAYARWLAPDEPNFVEPKKVVFLFAEEEVLSSRVRVTDYPSDADGDWSPWTTWLSVKLIQLVMPSANPDWASDEDAELGFSIGALRHVRSRPVPEIYAERSPKLAGVRELWWPTLSAFEAGVRRNPGALETLLAKASDFHTLLGSAERVK